MAGAPVDVLKRVPLFADLDRRELAQVARLFKERRFQEGETVAREGSGGAAFFLIDAGEAGHINADSGFGPWPEGSMAFAKFLTGL